MIPNRYSFTEDIFEDLTGLSRLVFDERLHLLEGRCGRFSNKNLARRFAQLFFREDFKGLMCSYPVHLEEGGELSTFFYHGTSFDIVFSDGKPRVRWKTRVLVSFALRYIAVKICFYLCLLARIGLGQKNFRDVLLFDSDLSNTCDTSSFEKFCENGQIPIFKQRIVVSRRSPGLARGRFFYTKQPVIYALSRAKFSLRQIFDTFFEDWFFTLEFVQLLWKDPSFLVLWKDFVQFPFLLVAGNHGIIKHFVISNSESTNQDLWMSPEVKKEFLAHYIWYSCNNKPFVFKENVSGRKAKAYIEYPYMSLTRFDCSWVWSQWQKDWLHNLFSGGRVEVVGPILFGNNEIGSRIAEKGESNEKIILVFDVTPKTDEFLVKIAGKGAVHYYAYPVLKRFIQEIVSEAESSGEKVQVLLKPKRKRNIFDSPEYFELVESLAKNQRIVIVHPETNLKTLIKMSNLVISIPYTSPAYVASAMGVKSVFYDPTGELDSSFYQDEEKSIAFIESRAELKKTIQEL